MNSLLLSLRTIFRITHGENLTEELLNSYERTARNPFRFSMTEHSDEENVEASLFAIAAYSVAKKYGKKTALDYIKRNYNGE